MILTALLIGGCSGRTLDERNSGTGTPPPTIEKVLERQSAAWMSIPGVVGTGIGTCDGVRCLKVFVVERTPEIESRIPAGVEGYPVRVEVTGRVRPRD